MMYESYWNLASQPFESSSDEAVYYPSETHQGALLKLRYAVENRRGAALLAGPAGVGKTLLVRMLWKQLEKSFSPQVHLVFPEMPTDQLLAYVADELEGQRTDLTPSVRKSVGRIGTFLSRNAADGQHAIVVVDEAQALTDSNSLETLRLLLNFEHEMKPAMTLLLVGQPSLLPQIERMPELDSCLAVKCLLRPLSCDETAAYVLHRLRAAGREEPIFEGKALEAIHYFAHGSPRQINRVCDLALLVGYAEQHSEITASHIEAISQELVSVAPE